MCVLPELWAPTAHNHMLRDTRLINIFYPPLESYLFLYDLNILYFEHGRDSDQQYPSRVAKSIQKGCTPYTIFVPKMRMNGMAEAFNLFEVI